MVADTKTSGKASMGIYGENSPNEDFTDAIARCYLRWKRIIILKINMKYISKKEFAERAGVSKRTFGRWMARHDAELRRLGVEKHDKLVSPMAARQIA